MDVTQRQYEPINVAYLTKKLVCAADGSIHVPSGLTALLMSKAVKMEAAVSQSEARAI